MIHTILQRKLKIEQRDPPNKLGGEPRCSLELNVQSRVTLDPFIPTLEGIVCTISTNEIDKIN
jgi:hypothetical protein